MRPDRRTLLSAAALVVVLGAVAWTFFGPTAAAPTTVAPREGRQTAAAGLPLPVAEGVRLAALSAPRAKPSEATRDPFRFRAGGAAGPANASSSPGAPVFTPTPAPAAPAEPAGPPPPPPIPLKFIGMVETADGLILAVLSQGEGRAPMHGKEGDIIDGRYRILKIGTESIEMAYLDGRGRQTIRLTGQ
jgi:hypothetical protein